MKKKLFILVILIICLSFTVVAKSQSVKTLSDRVAQLEADLEQLRPLIIEFSDELAIQGVEVTALKDDMKEIRPLIIEFSDELAIQGVEVTALKDDVKALRNSR